MVCARSREQRGKPDLQTQGRTLRRHREKFDNQSNGGAAASRASALAGLTMWSMLAEELGIAMDGATAELLCTRCSSTKDERWRMAARMFATFFGSD
jgi:hypothetical protein